MLTLMGTALSLLLVFRTNSSYTRWLDSRKMWGLLTNRSRDIARQFFTNADEIDVKDAFRRWLICFVRCFKNHLRVDGDDRADLEPLLKPHEFEAIMAAKHKPLFALEVLSELLRMAKLPPPYHACVDNNLTQFNDIVGGCERILRTPIPLSYTRHTSRFMILWLACLPFGLWPRLKWDSVPATFIISFMFLGIEEIGGECWAFGSANGCRSKPHAVPASCGFCSADRGAIQHPASGANVRDDRGERQPALRQLLHRPPLQQVCRGGRVREAAAQQAGLRFRSRGAGDCSGPGPCRRQPPAVTQTVAPAA